MNKWEDLPEFEDGQILEGNQHILKVEPPYTNSGDKRDDTYVPTGFLSKLRKADKLPPKTFMDWKARNGMMINVPKKLDPSDHMYQYFSDDENGERWGHEQVKNPDWKPMKIYVIDEIAREGWEVAGYRSGKSQSWVVVKHPFGFLVEIYTDNFFAHLIGTPKDGRNYGWGMRGNHPDYVDTAVGISGRELQGKFRWEGNKLIKE